MESVTWRRRPLSCHCRPCAVLAVAFSEEIARYRQFAELLRPQIVDSVTLIHEEASFCIRVLLPIISSYPSY